MCLWIQLSVDDVLACGVDFDFGPTFVQEVIIVLLVNGNARVTVRAEEEPFARADVHEQTFELTIEVVHPGVLEKMTRRWIAKALDGTGFQFVVNPITCDDTAPDGIGEIMTHAMEIIFA